MHKSKVFHLFLTVITTINIVAFLPKTTHGQDSTNYPTIGKVIRYDESLDNLLDPKVEIEVLTSGFLWSEGPLWVKDENHQFGGYVLFSDVPNNKIVRWDEGKGASTWMKPSGYTGTETYGSSPGSNGLLLDKDGQLIICEHGDRRISRVTQNGGKLTLADSFEGRRFHSPNDACLGSDKTSIYFTDPPFGLPDGLDDSRRELDFCGVYQVKLNRRVTLLTKEVTIPNGLAFSPDYKTLYVAQADPKAALWKSFPVNSDGTLGSGKKFFDATEYSEKGLPGLPDGLKVDKDGNIWATGPGGIYIFKPDATLIGRISTGEKTSNCAWGNDGSTLYITADTYLCRIRTKTKGAGW